MREIRLKSGIFGVRNDEMKTVYFGVSDVVVDRKRRIEWDLRRGIITKVLGTFGKYGLPGLKCWVVVKCFPEKYAQEMGNVVREYVGEGWTVYGGAVRTSGEKAEVVEVKGDWDWWIELGKRLMGLGASKGELREWVLGKVEQIENQRGHNTSGG